MACWCATCPSQPEQMLLRFVEGRPVSAVTTAFLAWCSDAVGRARAHRRAADLGQRVVAHQPRGPDVAAQHNHHVKQTGQGVRILACRLPSKSPWLNPIEPKWVHGKRAIVEPDRLLSAPEVMERVYAY